MNLTVLGIETSCDETAAAVYETDKRVLSSELYSQIELHKKYGGVVPEIASRSHIEKINYIVQEALTKSGKNLDDIDVFAVTNRPGLPGSLLIGLNFAKSMAWAKSKKIIGVNHLEGHVFSSFLENTPEFPHICLTASGGHTSMYLVKNYGEIELIGQTLDDASGEAFDKISKLMDLGYPGGPIIEKLAAENGFQDIYKYPRLTHNNLDFSFSGLKTAVLYNLVELGAYDIKSKKFLKPDDKELMVDVSSSLLVCVADIFQKRLQLALKKYPEVRAITFVGGVACNKYIKNRFVEFAQNNNLSFYSPSPKFCTDNAAMIAFVGHYLAQQNKFDDYYLDIKLS